MSRRPDGVVFGTAGHVDHGKTTLVRALTGVDTDRWEEEKRRGLTIDLGFAPLDLDEAGDAGLVDVPGHEDFLKNMLAGASGIDALLLVVAADEGPMPQTAEHLAIASLLGVRRGVVAVSKSDRVEAEWLRLVVETTREEVSSRVGADDWPVIPVSGTTGQGLDALRRALADQAARVRGRPVADLFRLPVDRSFTVHGTGTVATGTIWSGSIRTGQGVRVLPGDREARVRSLQVHGTARDRVAAGRRCAAALVGLEPSDVPRGSVLVTRPVWRPSRRLGARLRVLTDPPRPLEHGQRVRLFHGTREVMARVLLPDAGAIQPGASGPGLLRLEEPLIVRARDRFILRFYSPITTIGGGRVAEPRAARGWRERADSWDAVLDGSAAEAVAAVVEASGDAGAAADELAWRSGIPTDRIADVLESPPDGLLSIDELWFAADRLSDAERALLDRLARLHRDRPRAATASLEALRAAGEARYASALVDRALRELSARGAIVTEGPGVRLPDHEPRLTPRETEGKDRLLARLETGGAQPPSVAELAEELGLERDLLHDLLTLLEGEGRIVAVTPELYLTSEVLAELEREARAVLERERLASPSAFKECFGVTRKYLIPLLEYLDRTGVTRRTGEGRELAG